MMLQEFQPNQQIESREPSQRFALPILRLIDVGLHKLIERVTQFERRGETGTLSGNGDQASEHTVKGGIVARIQTNPDDYSEARFTRAQTYDDLPVVDIAPEEVESDQSRE